MKRLLLTIGCLCISFITFAQQDDFSLEAISNIGLKIIQIETVNHEKPTCDLVEAPEGSMGMTVTNTNTVPCKIVITQLNDTLYDSGEYEQSVSGATIKINGNTSAYFSTKDNYPYKLKLQKKKDLLFRNDDQYADKNWRLIKDTYTLNTIIGFKISELLQFPWTPNYTPCNVFINGEYIGCYLLIESVKRNEDCRLDVDKESGYIVERDPYWWNESDYFTTDYFEPYPRYRWTWKYPSKENITPSYESYITNYINQSEQSIKNGTYEKFIDVHSFARWILVHDILGSSDSGGTNIYVTKYDNSPESVLQMPVLWDFDSNFRMEPGQFCKCHNEEKDYYYYHLFNSDNKIFTKVYKQLWNNIKPFLRDSICGYISDYINSKEGKALEKSREIYFKRMEYTETTTMEEDALEAITWFGNHLILLDDEIGKLDETTEIRKVTVDNSNKVIYNLSGIRIKNIRKGLYIKDKKLYIQK